GQFLDVDHPPGRDPTPSRNRWLGDAEPASESTYSAHRASRFLEPGVAFHSRLPPQRLPTVSTPSYLPMALWQGPFGSTPETVSGRRAGHAIPRCRGCFLSRQGAAMTRSGGRSRGLRILGRFRRFGGGHHVRRRLFRTVSRL